MCVKIVWRDIPAYFCSMRMDKYIWCVRLCKTRTTASKECASEKVLLNDAFVKGSKDVKVGDEVAMKHGPIWRRYEILSIPKSRVGAKLVVDLIKETTAPSDLEMLRSIELENKQNRQIGIFGRNKKKTRRVMEKFRKEFGEE